MTCGLMSYKHPLPRTISVSLNTLLLSTFVVACFVPSSLRRKTISLQSSRLMSVSCVPVRSVYLFSLALAVWTRELYPIYLRKLFRRYGFTMLMCGDDYAWPWHDSWLRLYWKHFNAWRAFFVNIIAECDWRGISAEIIKNPERGEMKAVGLCCRTRWAER